MDITPEMHEAARIYYTVMVEGGAAPNVVVGSSLDGLTYFPTTIGNSVLWLTPDGLLDPDTLTDATAG